MWRRYFRFKLVPGVVITQRFGRLDFRQDDLSVHMLQKLYEDDFPYLELTKEGKRVLYGVDEYVAAADHAPAVDVAEEIEQPVTDTEPGSKRKVSRKRKLE